MTAALAIAVYPVYPTGYTVLLQYSITTTKMKELPMPIDFHCYVRQINRKNKPCHWFV